MCKSKLLKRVVVGVVGTITQDFRLPLLHLPGVKEKCFYSPAGCQQRVKGERNESYGAVKKKNLSKV